MLFLTYLFVLSKRAFQLIIGPFFVAMFCQLNSVSYFIEPVYLLFGEQKTEGRLDFFDERIHLELLTRGEIEIPAGGISLPFCRQIGSSQKTETSL